MKILHTVELYEPSIGGMQEVVKQLSERLVKLGHDVTIATTALQDRNNRIINGVKIVEFNISGNLARGLSGDIHSYKKYLLNSDFDVITNFAAQQWATDIMFSLFDRIHSKKVFVPTGFSALHMPEYKTYFDQMKSWMNKYDMNIFLSHNYRDINFARANNIRNITVITNGASKEEFLTSEISFDIKKRLNIPDDYLIVLHIGSHTGLKGHNEAIKIYKKAKLKRSVLVIIGNSLRGGCVHSCRYKAKVFNFSPVRLIDNKLIMISVLNRLETVALYKAADIFLFPSKIECSPLVLFECMASKTPFLTTDVGNASEIIEWSRSGILLPTIKNSFGSSTPDISKSASILEHLCNNFQMRVEMSEYGFKAWEKSFTWEYIVNMYEKLYLNLIKNGSKHVSAN